MHGTNWVKNYKIETQCGWNKWNKTTHFSEWTFKLNWTGCIVNAFEKGGKRKEWKVNGILSESEWIERKVKARNFFFSSFPKRHGFNFFHIHMKCHSFLDAFYKGLKYIVKCHYVNLANIFVEKIGFIEKSPWVGLF